MVLGSIVIFASIIFPEMITPFAQGIPMKEIKDSAGMFDGTKQYKFMRAFFGIVVCSGIGITVTLFTKARPLEELKGFVWGTISSAIEHYKGSAGNESESATLLLLAQKGASDTHYGGGDLPAVRISPKLAEKLQAQKNDLVYVSDKRWWLGGLRSGHAIIEEITEAPEEQLLLSDSLYDLLCKGREQHQIRIQRLY